MAAVPPSSSMRNAADNPWFAGVDGCRTGWVAAFAPAVGGDVRVRIVARFADVFGRARGAERGCGRYSDRPAGACGPRWQGGRECRAAPSRRTTVFGVFGPVAGGACGRGLCRCLPDRVRQLGAAAQGLEAAVHAGAENPRGRRVAARRCGFGRARLRGPSRGRVLAAQRGARVARAQEGQGPMLRARTCVAAKPARRCRHCRGTGERRAAEGRRRR